MDTLSDKVVDSLVIPEFFLYAPLLLAVLLCYFNRRRSRLPPLCSLSLREFVEGVITGRIHHRLLEISKEIGLVYRLYFPFQMAHHFIVCDATLGRLILEGDTSKKIEPGEKLERMKLFDKLTMNKPNIL
jgi:hypothetical protein